MMNANFPSIVFDAERMKYPYTGLYQYCYHLAHALLSSDKRKENNLGLFLPASCHQKWSVTFPIIPQKTCYKYWTPLSWNNIKVWHCTYQLSSYDPPKKAKQVTTVHDLNFLHENKKTHKVKNSLQLLNKRIDRSDIVVCISHYVKKELLAYSPAIKGKKVVVIYNGCNSLSGSMQRPPYLLNLSSPFILAMGTVLIKKNFHTLIPLLQKNSYHLVIAGVQSDLSYVDKIRAEMAKWNVLDRVHLIGAVNEPEKSWLLYHCDAFCFPSIAEGFGLPVVEAMQLGKPIFLSAFTALPEIGGDVAYYFNTFAPEDMYEVFQKGMNHYQQNPHQCEEIKERASLFDWRISGNSYWDIYHELLTNSF